MDGSEEEYSIHSLCRICLDTLRAETAFDLFLVPGLAKKLCVCTSLSVEPQDGFPRNICGGCFSRLNDLHDFQKLCVDSVQRFQEIVAKNGFCFTSIDNAPPVEDEQGIQTTLCDDDERLNFDPLLNHKQELIENEIDVFKMIENVDKEVEETVKRCKDEEDNEKTTNLKSDKKIFSSESSNESEPDAYNDDDDDLFVPNRDDDGSDSDDKPLVHRVQKTRSKTKLGYDDSNSDDEEKGDKNSKGSQEKPKRKRIPAAERHLHRIIECHICHQKFKKAERYQEHMKHHNEELPHQCTVESCRKGFTTTSSLRLHVEHCHPETLELLTCPVEGCGRTFPRSRSLNWHLNKAHNIIRKPEERKNYPCTECEKVFRCPMALKKHMYKHDGKELPFPCNICGKRFVINSALKDHLMRHAGIKNYVCPYCGIGKTTRQEWNTHIAIHTQEKKFKCELCPHATHNKGNLRLHVKIVHEKIKDFACQYCGKTFGKTSACKRHEQTHLGEKRFECKVCDKRFLHAKSLSKHLTTHEKPSPRNRKTGKGKNAQLPDDQSLLEGKTQEEILKLCAESAATIPKDPRRVERVDISVLAGTSVNPIPSVSVPSWTPQMSFTTKEGQFVCPECGQGFNTKGNMKKHHRIVHERIKDFACQYCTRRFAKPDTLKHHEMTHTGEKPHECNVCNKRFIQYVTLKRHMKVHMARPPKVVPPIVYEAHEELQQKEREKLEAKKLANLQKEKERAVVAEAAMEQLNLIQEQEKEMQKKKNSLTINAPLVPDPRIDNIHFPTPNDITN